MGVPARLTAWVAPLQARLSAWCIAHAPHCPRTRPPYRQLTR